MPKLFRASIYGALVALILFAGAEIGLRLAGFGSFPLYQLDKDFGYIPAANQSGSFWNRNRWSFNDRSMGNAEPWSPAGRNDILLIGNSIVMGGLPYDRDEKIAPLLQRNLGSDFRVWSVAAGGWSNVNEMAFFDKHREVLEASEVVIIEYMDGGLSSASPWPGETVFPAHRPVSLSLYLIQKYLLPYAQGFFPTNDSGALPPSGAPDPAQLERFGRFVAQVRQTSAALILLYPDAALLADMPRWRAAIAPIAAICRSLSVGCLDLAETAAWRPNLYKDGIHPTIEGNGVLARILADAIERTVPHP